MSGTVQFTDADIRDVEFGRDVRVVRPVNLYGCRIGDGAFIGPLIAGGLALLGLALFLTGSALSMR